MKKLIWVLCVWLMATPVSAADHLLPEESIFTGIFYEKTFSLMSSRLGRMHDFDIFANVVVLPSFSRDYVILFEKNGDRYKLICMQTKQSLVSYQYLEMMKAGTFTYSDKEAGTDTEDVIAEFEAKLPANYMDVEAEVLEFELDEQLGRELYAAWGQMLYDTHYPDPGELTPETSATFGPGNDGTTYHFSFFHRGTPLSGWIWDFPPESRVEKLVAIVTAAKERCDVGSVGDNEALSARVRELSDALSGNGE